MKCNKNLELSVSFMLYRRRCFGSRQILLEVLVNKFPDRIQKQVKQTINEMVRKGHLVQRPTKNGKALYINPKFRKQIQKEIEAEFKKKYPFL